LSLHLAEQPLPLPITSVKRADKPLDADEIRDRDLVHLPFTTRSQWAFGDGEGTDY
jgi:hypothetical protein